MLSFRILATFVTLLMAPLAASSAAIACDKRIPGSCKPEPPVVSTTETAAPKETQYVRTGSQTRRAKRYSRRSYRRSRASRSSIRFSRRSSRGYSRGHRRARHRTPYPPKREAAVERRKTRDRSELDGRMLRTETDDAALRRLAAMPAGGETGRSAAAAALPRPMIASADPAAPAPQSVLTPNVVSTVRITPPKPSLPAAPAPVVAFASEPAPSMTTGSVAALTSAAPREASDFTMLRAAFLALAGILAVATAWRLAVG